MQLLLLVTRSQITHACTAGCLKFVYIIDGPAMRSPPQSWPSVADISTSGRGMSPRRSRVALSIVCFPFSSGQSSRHPYICPGGPCRGVCTVYSVYLCRYNWLSARPTLSRSLTRTHARTHLAAVRQAHPDGPKIHTELSQSWALEGFLNFFTNKKLFFAFFYQVNLTGSGLFQ